MAIESGPPNIYKPLAATNEIRLLYLQPQSWNEGVICEMRHVKLSDRPHYEALSYMWGSQKEKSTIILDSQGFRVGQNLELALDHLKLAKEPRVLWIDALCINQSDIAERNRQVSQMSQIYTGARRVIAWLGPSDDTSSKAIRAMSTLMPNFLLSYRSWLDYEKHGFEDQVLKPIKSFCSRRYWDRLWIIQELVLATDICIQCGTEQLRWSTLCTFFVEFEAHGGIAQSLPLDADARDTMPARLVREWKNRKTSDVIEGYIVDRSLCSLYYRYEKAKCQDPRDKIYGLRSFAGECCNDAVPIDYSMPRYDLCGLLFQHHVLNHLNDKDEANNRLGYSYRVRDDTNDYLRRPKYLSSQGAPASIIRTSQLFHQSMRVTSSERPPSTSAELVQEPLGHEEIEIPDFDNATLDIGTFDIPLFGFTESPITNIANTLQINGAENFSTSPSATGPLAFENEDSPKTLTLTGIIEPSETDTTSQISSSLRWHPKLSNLPTKVRNRLSLPSAFTSARKKAARLSATITAYERSSKPSLDSASTSADFSAPKELKSPTWPEETLVAAPGTFCKVLGDYKGRISYLLPSGVGDAELDFGSTMIEQRLANLEGIQVTHETDLACRNYGGQYRVSFPVDFKIPKSRPVSMPTGFPGCPEDTWAKAQKELNKIVSKDCMVAIEEHGYLCFVPHGTKIGDLVCFFPETDVVAIVRPSGSNGQIVGRAVSIYEKPPADTLIKEFGDRGGLSERRNSSGGEESAQDESAVQESITSMAAKDDGTAEPVVFPGPGIPVLFELDVSTLQLLTHASAPPLTKPYRVIKSQPLLWPGSQYFARPADKPETAPIFQMTVAGPERPVRPNRLFKEDFIVE
ncbi:hypothetical protein BP6252_02998 [Coleophoma cylindrospora]|uniref:Heterokaryon incompatibility domain-containing protein n=1 Tax=Coleophoma cylindrospora TaxID=1849047 RepID=A0A3D8S6K1_9HELO|nr:hypothetical protein BP6252_02998 [Coleophoma cylindrospora]